MILGDSTLQVQVDSVRVLDDKLLVLINNLFVRGGYPWISCIKVSENCMVTFLLCFNHCLHVRGWVRKFCHRCMYITINRHDSLLNYTL